MYRHYFSQVRCIFNLTPIFKVIYSVIFYTGPAAPKPGQADRAVHLAVGGRYRQGEQHGAEGRRQDSQGTTSTVRTVYAK